MLLLGNGSELNGKGCSCSSVPSYSASWHGRLAHAFCCEPAAFDMDAKLGELLRRSIAHGRDAHATVGPQAQPQARPAVGPAPVARGFPTRAPRCASLGTDWKPMLHDSAECSADNAWPPP